MYVASPMPGAALPSGAAKSRFQAISGISTAIGFAGRMGGGIDIFVTDNLAINTEGYYVMPTGNIQGLRYVGVGLGLTYHFRE